MRHLTIAEFGVFLGVNGNRLVVHESDGSTWETPLSRLRTVRVAKAGVSLSSNVILACAERGIRLYFCDWRGVGVAAVSGLHQHAVVSVRKAQFAALGSPFAFEFAREFIVSKLRNQRAVLLYFNKYVSKNSAEASALLAASAETLQAISRQLAGMNFDDDWRQKILGREGAAASNYWKVLGQAELLSPEFVQREGRGSTELTNVCLNYGYSILLSYCWSALDNAGLELYSGFLHTDRPGKPSLVLDFMEEYRAWVVDRVVIKLRQQIAKAKRFDQSLKSELSRMIADCMSSEILYRGKRLRLENVMQRQAYRLAGAVVDKKKYKGIRFKW